MVLHDKAILTQLFQQLMRESVKESSFNIKALHKLQCRCLVGGAKFLNIDIVLRYDNCQELKT
nr:hypothetical protein Iba_chr03eCG3790 [Ipomoea batatas]